MSDRDVYPATMIQKSSCRRGREGVFAAIVLALIFGLWTLGGKAVQQIAKAEEARSRIPRVPANTSATVSLPGIGSGPFAVQEGGTVVWSNGAYVSGVAGISGASVNGDRLEVQVGSGTYRFRIVGGE